MNLLRGLLLLLGLFLPFNLTSSIPSLGDEEKRFGWSTTHLADRGESYLVIHRTMRHGYTHGVRTGDVLRSIDGEVATDSTLERVRRNAVAGDTLRLVVERGGELVELRVPVTGHSASYTGYFWYRFAVGIAGWALGMALVVWRGSGPGALVLAAALLLLIPVTISSGVHGDGVVATIVRSGWQLQAAAFRFFSPALLAHFLVIATGRPARLRSPLLWLGVYAALFVTLALVTDLFRTPMAWGQFGPQRELRAIAGFPFELLATGVAWTISRSPTGLPLSVRWLAYGILAISATSVFRSVIGLALGEENIPEFFWRLHGLMLVLLPATAAAYLAVPVETIERGWAERRRLAAWLTAMLTGLYGVVVTAAAAVVLSSTDHRLEGAEWLLFASIFLAAVLFSPILRWSQELVDRRLFSRWVELETAAQAIIQAVSAELEPERIAARVATDVPRLLGASRARLVLCEEVATSWRTTAPPEFEVLPATSLRDDLARCRHPGTVTLVPIERPDGTLIGALRIETATGMDAPRYAVAGTLAQGLASALRNAESYLELRRAQQDLADAERIASLGALAGGLAHEIKNPLAGLKMGLYLLERDGTDPRKITRIQRDLRRIDDLVSGLLRFTHEGASEDSGVIDLHALLGECIADLQPVAEDREITIRVHPDDGDLKVLASPGQLRLVISNVLQNALDAAGTGGVVDVGTAIRGPNAELTIRDSGPGIPAGLEERIFEINFSTKRGGTGLGLALARREVERLGGRITVDGGQGRGALLRIELPRHI